MKTIKIILLTLGILGLIICVGLYFIRAETIEVQDSPVNIVEAGGSIDKGFVSTDYYARIQVEPTKTTKPEIDYLLILNNGIVELEYIVSWEQLEIDIHKVKTITNKISRDEFTALEMKSSYTTKIFEIIPQHQILYIVLGIIIFIAGIIAYIYTDRKPNSIYSSGKTWSDGVPRSHGKVEEPSQVTSLPAITLEESIIPLVRQFKPHWVTRNGKRILEGGENGNNALLARYLRKRLNCKVEVEVRQSNGSKVDVLIDENVALECKPHLVSRGKLDNLVGEIKRINELAKYQVYAIIYGDARKDLHNRLCSEVGEKNVIILGNMINSKFDGE